MSWMLYPPTVTRPRTRSGAVAATMHAARPPQSYPARIARSMPMASRKSIRSCPMAACCPDRIVESSRNLVGPKPRRYGASRYAPPAARIGATSSNARTSYGKPCSRMTGVAPGSPADSKLICSKGVVTPAAEESAMRRSSHVGYAEAFPGGRADVHFPARLSCLRVSPQWMVLARQPEGLQPEVPDHCVLDLSKLVAFEVVNGIADDVVDVDASNLVNQEACGLAVYVEHRPKHGLLSRCRCGNDSGHTPRHGGGAQHQAEALAPLLMPAFGRPEVDAINSTAN